MRFIEPVLSTTDENQHRAVTTTEGPLLIIAGPGSGKTKTLVDRAIHLILSKKLKPHNLLISTFTEKAAAELRSRISLKLDAQGIRLNLTEMYLGTLHSIFLRLLQDHREYTTLKKNFALLEPFEQEYLVYRNFGEIAEGIVMETVLGAADRRSSWKRAQALCGAFNKLTERGFAPGALAHAANPEFRDLGVAYGRYLGMLENDNMLDFSLTQAKCLELLEDHPDVRSKLQEQIRYLMVDEYQDTNPIQEKILLLLAGSRANLCVVGDDDQALYRFRGATIANILRLPERFAGACTRVTLQNNYRSHAGIVRFFADYMEAQEWEHEGRVFRYPKQLQAKATVQGSYTPVLRLTGRHPDEQGYYEQVRQFIANLRDSGKIQDLNQVAFLFRSVKGERVLGLARYLEEHGMPVFSPRSALFFERAEVRLALGALIFLFPKLGLVLREKCPVEFEVWSYYEKCKLLFAEEVRKDPFKHKPMLVWANQLVRQHNELTKSTNYAFTALLYRLLGFPMFAEKVDVDLQGPAQSQRAAFNIAALTQLLHRFESLHNVSVLTPKNLDGVLRSLFNRYLRFLIDGGIEEYEDFGEGPPSGCLPFMTIHQAKGLEFPVVVCGSMSALPREQKSPIDDWIAEHLGEEPYEPDEQIKHFDFQRLYYTAFSRAQNLLVLTALEREGHGREPSKYLEPWYHKALPWQNADLSELCIEPKRQAEIKREYAYTSDVLLYENCPLQYKYYKAMGFAEARIGGAIGGTLLHQTIEDMHKAVLNGASHEVHAENVERWFEDNYRVLVRTQGGYLSPAVKASLLTQTQNYRKHQEKNWSAILEAEVDVSLVKERYILNGTIDLVRGAGETVEIVDFKSGKKPDLHSPWGRKMLLQYRRQLEIYAHLVEERSGQKVSAMKIYYAGEEDSNPYVPFPREKVDIAKTIAEVDQVIAQIEAKNFRQSSGQKCERLCGNCDFKFHCNPGKHE